VTNEKQIRTAISKFTTLEIARQWKADAEKILFFEYQVIRALDVGLSMWVHPRKYERTMIYFENLCDNLLKGEKN
jgi:hypothetical protein